MSPEGSVIVNVVSTINAPSMSGPEKNGVVYIHPRGSLRGIPGSGWAAGHMWMKMSTYMSNCCKDWRFGLIARRTCMKSSCLQRVWISHGWEGSAGRMKASPKLSQGEEVS
jgi:hypothetical protein